MTQHVIQLPETSWAWRAPFYQDVMRLITPGYLTAPVELGDSVLHLRTLLPADYQLLAARTYKATPSDALAWLLAHSVWMLNGRVLLDKPRNTEKLFSVFRELHPHILVAVSGQYSGLQARLDACSNALEPFLYEPHSRSIWRQFEAGGVFGGEGIEGLARLGRNYIQRAWFQWNQTEDSTEEIFERWKPFRFIASAIDAKGVTRIVEAEQKFRDAEEERRALVRDKYFWQMMGVVPRDEEEGETPQDQVRGRGGVVKSVATLEDEMARWVSGEQDEHDRFVESYKQRALLYRDSVLFAYEETARIAEEQRRLAEEEEEEMGYVPTSLTSYSQQDLEALGVRGTSGVRHLPAAEWANQDRLLALAKRGTDSGMLRVNPETKRIEVVGDAPELRMGASGAILLEGETEE